MVYIVINTNNIILLDIFDVKALNNKNKVIPIIAIPINTLTAELMLCFTTSVSFFASILGYFKFTIIPIVSDINGSKIDAYKAIIMFNMSNLNRIKTIISPISIQGTIISIAVSTFDCIILKGFIGRLFKILNDLPSNDNIKLVIDVIKLVKHINPKNNVGK